MSGEHLDEPLDYLYEELPPERMAEVRRHLAECPECRAEMRGIRDAVKNYRLAPRPSTPPGLAARATARALGEVAAERHAAAPAPEKKPESANFISAEKFDQEFARLKEEVMGEMKRGWRAWLTHPAWVVATCAFFICAILIHVSPRMNRQYEQILPSYTRGAAPRREIAERVQPPSPEASPREEEEIVATEPSATLLQAEAMSEPLAVEVSEPAASTPEQAPSAEDESAAIPPSAENTAPALSKLRQTAPSAANATGGLVPPPARPLQKQEASAPAVQSPEPASEIKEQHQTAQPQAPLRPPAGTTETSMARDEAPAPFPTLEMPSLPALSPTAQPEPTPAAPIPEKAREDGYSTAAAVPVAPPPAPAAAVPATGGDVYGGMDDSAAQPAPPQTPPSPVAVPAQPAESRVAQENSAPVLSGSMPPLGSAGMGQIPPQVTEEKEPPPGSVYGSSVDQGVSLGDTYYPPLSTAPAPMEELPGPHASASAGSWIITMEDSPSDGVDEGAASAPGYGGAASLPPPVVHPYSAYSDSAPAYPESPAPSTPAAGFQSPQADLFAPVSPRARAPTASREETAEIGSFYSPGYPASSAPPSSATPAVPAPQFFDATGGPDAVPQIVERPTPVDRAESARNLTTLAALALAEGNVAEAWEAVRMLRTIDPKAADQVAKWITELEEARAVAEQATTESAPPEPYIPQDTPPTSVLSPTPMEVVEPPENPPLTEVMVPAHMAQAGQRTAAASPARPEPTPVVEAVPVPVQPPPGLSEERTPEAEAEENAEENAKGEEESSESDPAAASPSRRPAGSSLWYGTVGRDIRPLGPSRQQPAGQVWGRRPGTGKPFTTDPYLRDD